MSTERDPIDAADELLSYLERDSDVVYAETGGVFRRRRTATLDTTRSNTETDAETTGVWCRAFANGSAGYRFTPVLTTESLQDTANRVTRSAKNLAQDTPSSYDYGTMHRASHPGWNSDAKSFEDVDPIERLQEATSPLESTEYERLRLSYKRDRLDISVLTTTDSAIQTTLDRGQVTASVTPPTGPKLQTHVGTTTGSGVLDRVESEIESLADSIERRATIPVADDRPTGEQTVVFSPNAAGQLIHHCSQFFEMDTAYAGAMPFEHGEQIGPPELSIHDTVPAGSWAGLAYDAEGRPTQPVTLVDNGEVTSFLHSVETAIEEETSPSGNLVFPLGFEHPPRIHPRHLDVEAGSTDSSTLEDGATVRIDRIGRVSHQNEATNAKRVSGAPASALYAHNTNRLTPDEYNETHQSFQMDIVEGYALQDGDRVATLTDATIAFDVTDLASISGVGARRDTVTGTSQKHNAMFPYAVTAPTLRLRTKITDQR